MAAGRRVSNCVQCDSTHRHLLKHAGGQQLPPELPQLPSITCQDPEAVQVASEACDELPLEQLAVHVCPACAGSWQFQLPPPATAAVGLLSQPACRSRATQHWRGDANKGACSFLTQQQLRELLTLVDGCGCLAQPCGVDPHARGALCSQRADRREAGEAGGAARLAVGCRRTTRIGLRICQRGWRPCAVCRLAD